MEQAYSRWLTHVTEPELQEQLKNMSEQERQEAFCRELSFGTGGLRSGSKRRQGLSLPEIGADPGAQLGRALFFMRRRHLHHGKPQPRAI